jgi:hypothetical protein
MSLQKHSPKSNGETEVDLRQEIEKEVSALFEAERNDFNFTRDTPEDLEQLADELFDALFEHTNL